MKEFICNPLALVKYRYKKIIKQSSPEEVTKKQEISRGHDIFIFNK